MIALDTSVAVAAFATWHEGHQSARAAMGTDPRLPAHVAIETYAVLTRLPPPHRAAPAVAAEFLAAQFPHSPLVLSPGGYRRLQTRAAAAGIAGGAIYDALVAAEVLEAGAALLTRDRRAARTYDAFGLDYKLLE